jgi:hypothetical protein
MMQLTLRRTSKGPDGVFGKLYVPGHGELYTGEEEWLDNKKGLSSIPAGKYILKRTMYYKHGFETFEVTGVKGRKRILIHPGNTEEDTMGCILLGNRQGPLTVRDEDDPKHPFVTKQAVLDSWPAFRRFMYWMTGVNEAELTVEWA